MLRPFLQPRALTPALAIVLMVTALAIILVRATV